VLDLLKVLELDHQGQHEADVRARERVGVGRAVGRAGVDVDHVHTIVVLCALQGRAITSNPLDVARIALPLLAYFAVMWGGGYALGAGLGLGYQRTTTLAFTAAGNNFELAIAVAIATFGVTSGQALAGVVGPLIEVPVLVGLVYVSLALRRRFKPSRREPAARLTASS